MNLKNFYKYAYDEVITKFNYNESLVSFRDMQLPVLKNLPPARSYLELGCGQGVHFESKSEVWGVDFCENALDLAQNDERFDHVKFICQDVSELNLEMKFDMILDSHLFHCIVDEAQRKKYLTRVFEHLSTEGLFYLETMVSHKELNFETEMEYFFFDPLLQKGDIPVRYIAPPEKIEKEILEAGFNILYFYINSAERMIPTLNREVALRSDPITLRIIATKNYHGE